MTDSENSDSTTPPEPDATKPDAAKPENPAAPSPPADDWPQQAADALEQVVGVVRDHTVAPAQRVTKAIVYGLLATFFVITALTILIIGIFRGLVVLTGDVWAAYLITGGIFVTAGALLWSRRSKPARR